MVQDDAPSTAGRPVLVCVVAISSMTLIAIIGLLTRSLSGDLLVMIFAFIAGTGGIGAGAHLAAAERTRSAVLLNTVISHLAARTPAAPAQP